MSAVVWTPEMLATLQAMRAANVPIYLCAERIGFAYDTAVYKCRELGIADRRNRGRMPGTALTTSPEAT